MATENLEIFSDDELLKSISELDNEIMKAMGGEAASSSGPAEDMTSEEGSDEDPDSEDGTEASDEGESDTSSGLPFGKSEDVSDDETGTEGESATGMAVKGMRGDVEVNRVKGSGKIDHDVPHNATTQHGKKGHFRSGIEDGHGMRKSATKPGMGVDVASALDPHVGPELSKQSTKAAKGYGNKMAKSFSDVASPEAERTLDVTPFLAAQAEAMDSIAEVVNDLAKSLDGFGAKDDLLAKSVVDVGRGLIDTRKQLADVFESLNDIRKGLRMPVRQAPKSALTKSDAGQQVDRFEQAAPSLNKSQTAGIITDLVIKGLVDPMAVSAYEATGWMDRTTEQAVQAEVTARFSRRA